MKIIVACDENGLIGDKNKIPWHIPEDLKHFKRTTNGHPIIMGRKTWESIGKKPLHGRKNVVFTRNLSNRTVYNHRDVRFTNDIESVCLTYNEGFVIGGSQIYKVFMDMGKIDEIIMSCIKGTYKGDCWFPHYKDIMKKWKSDIIKEYDDFTVISLRRK